MKAYMKIERFEVRAEKITVVTKSMIEAIKAFLADLLIFTSSLSSLARNPRLRKPKNPKNP
jgi:hypothetical protein